MSEPETGFENARVGDRVYSPLFKSVNPTDTTNGVINSIYNEDSQIEMKPDVPARYYTLMRFSFDGSFPQGGGQVVFWSNPINEIPTRPKRKVVKKGWIGIRPDLEGVAYHLAKTSNIYSTKEELEKYDSYILKPYQLKEIEFEVEE